ncbi:unnamed protein product [Penicillium salamii]|uniref:Uncharacterized protein n=1 Tax=Penicillium salamii TaxID=1612424 RepID=A0A9W4IB90_9EURO|nr:unnamed protein product [Penicillium salamii]
MMVPSSNQKRAYIRQHCREALAAHISNVLYPLFLLREVHSPQITDLVSSSLFFFSSQICLQPSAEDRYAWSLMETHDELLQSNLGSGSVSLYQAGRLSRSLCRRRRWPNPNRAICQRKR